MTLKHDLLTPEQAAEHLGLSVKTLAIWRSTNRQRLPFTRIGRRIRYRAADLHAFVAAGLQHATE